MSCPRKKTFGVSPTLKINVNSLNSFRRDRTWVLIFKRRNNQTYISVEILLLTLAILGEDVSVSCRFFASLQDGKVP